MITIKKTIFFFSFLFFSFLFFSFQFFSFSLSSQCTVHGRDGVSTEIMIVFAAGEYAGQTFIACQTGEITSITFDLNTSTQVGTNNFRLGPSTNLPTVADVLVAGTVLETFTNVAGAQTITITLTTPFPVTNGNIYAFELEHGGGGAGNLFIDRNNTDDYADGIAYQDNGGGFATTTGDFDFGVMISGDPKVPVPTLGEWSLIALTLKLLTFGVVAIRERFTLEGRKV